jgi:hypothetical protein
VYLSLCFLSMPCDLLLQITWHVLLAQVGNERNRTSCSACRASEGDELEARKHRAL